MNFFFTLIDVDQKEHAILEDVNVTSDNSYLLVSSLNEKESLSRDEENCHILGNTTTTSGIKENGSKICVHNMEQYSPNLIREIQDHLLGDSIINCSTDSPLILESSYFENSCDFLSPLPLYFFFKRGISFSHFFYLLFFVPWYIWWLCYVDICPKFFSISFGILDSNEVQTSNG